MYCVYIGEAGTLCWTRKQNVLFLFFSSLFLGEVNMYPEKLNLKRSTCLLSAGCLGNHTAVSLCHEGLSLSGIESVYIMSASANCLVMNVVPTSSSLAFEGALCLPANGRIINKHDRGRWRDFCMENMLVLPTCEWLSLYPWGQILLCSVTHNNCSLLVGASGHMWREASLKLELLVHAFSMKGRKCESQVARVFSFWEFRDDPLVTHQPNGVTPKFGAHPSEPKRGEFIHATSSWHKHPLNPLPILWIWCPRILVHMCAYTNTQAHNLDSVVEVM